MGRNPLTESAEQSVVPGPTPWNTTPPDPSEAVTGMATFGSSHLLSFGGQRICPDAQTSKVSPTFKATGIGSSCARAWPNITRVTITIAMHTTTDLARMSHLAWTGYV